VKNSSEVLSLLKQMQLFFVQDYL